MVFTPSPGSSSASVQAPPSEPWLQSKYPPSSMHDQSRGLIQQLERTRLQEQAVLQQQGIVDPLETEFTAVVEPILETCTKESIAVSDRFRITFYNHI